MTNRATYNITDDRFKLYLDERLSDEDYKRARALNFQWFPGQKCFSSIWYPRNEDFILEFVDEIANDENPDDVESRVARFKRYARDDEDAAYDAQDRAQNATTARRARLAERTAANKLEEARYWQDRIAGAIRHAEYKDRPDVIARRIKKLEASHRKHTKELKESRAWLARWQGIPGNVKRKDGNPVTFEEAVNYFKGYDSIYFQVDGSTKSAGWLLEDGTITHEQVQAKAIEKHERNIETDERWIEHLDLRLEYERAYLAAVAGEDTAQALTAPQPRRKSVAPDDGLKKGDVVTYTTWFGGTTVITGPIVRLFAKTVHIELPKDHRLYEHCQKYEGGVFKAGRKFVKKVE